MEKSKLHNVAEQIEAIVRNWENVEVQPHRFGGREFRFRGKEFGHIHIHGILDIPFSRKIRDQLVEEGLASRHHYLPETGWITYIPGDPSDVEHALKLLRFSYLRHRIRQNDKPGQAASELRLLQFTDALLNLVIPAELKQANNN